MSAKRRHAHFAIAARAAVVVAAMLFASCAPKKEAREEPVDKTAEEEAPPATPSPGTPAGEFSVDGTVLKKPAAGGCWVIHSLEGTEFEPINLKDEYRFEGTRVRALLRTRADMASTCNVGTIVEVVAIEMLD
jgi:hypothetical protein